MTKEIKGLIEQVQKNNKEFKKKWAKLQPKKLKTKYTAKEQNVIDVFKKHDFGCQNKSLMAFTNAFLGKELVNPEMFDNSSLSIEIPKGVCIVPLKNTNDHNYDIGKVAFAGINYNYNYSMYREDGSIGNTMSNEATSFRIATDKETEKFINTFIPNLISTLAN